MEGNEDKKFEDNLTALLKSTQRLIDGKSNSKNFILVMDYIIPTSIRAAQSTQTTKSLELKCDDQLWKNAKSPVLDYWLKNKISFEKGETRIRIGRVDIPAFLKTVQVLYSCAGSSVVNYASNDREDFFTAFYLGLPLTIMTPSLKQDKIFEEILKLDAKSTTSLLLGLSPNRPDIIPAILQNTCRLKHPPHLQGTIAVRRPVRDGSPRVLPRKYGLSHHTVLTVHPISSVSTNRISHFCVNHFGVTVIAFDVTTIIIQVPINCNLPSNLCGKVGITWPNVHLVLCNPNGILVDDLALHNVARLTLSTGPVTVKSGEMNFEVLEGSVTVCGRGINLKSLKNVSVFGKYVFAGADVEACNLEIVSGQSRIIVPIIPPEADCDHHKIIQIFNDKEPISVQTSPTLVVLPHINIVATDTLFLTIDGNAETSGHMRANKFASKIAGNLRSELNSSFVIICEAKFDIAGTWAHMGYFGSESKAIVKVGNYLPGDAAVLNCSEMEISSKEFHYTGHFNKNGKLLLDTHLFRTLPKAELNCKEARIHSTTFENDDGTIKGKDCVYVTSEQIKNGGKITGELTNFRSKRVSNQGEIMGSSDLTIFCEQIFANDKGGEMYGGDVINLDFPKGINGGFISAGNEMLISANEFTMEDTSVAIADNVMELRGLKLLKNNGHIGSYKKLTINGNELLLDNNKDGIISSGSIHLGSDVSRTEVLNSGTVFATASMDIWTQSGLTNHVIGKIHSNGLTTLSSSAASNYGLIAGCDGLKISVVKHLSNYQGGIITGQDIELASDNHTNHSGGTIRAGNKLTANVKTFNNAGNMDSPKIQVGAEEIYNKAGGIISGDFVQLTSTGPTSNEGFLDTNILTSNSDNFSNCYGAEVKSAQPTFHCKEDFVNTGKINGKNLQVDGRNCQLRAGSVQTESSRFNFTVAMQNTGSLCQNKLDVVGMSFTNEGNVMGQNASINCGEKHVNSSEIYVAETLGITSPSILNACNATMEGEKVKLAAEKDILNNGSISTETLDATATDLTNTELMEGNRVSVKCTNDISNNSRMCADEELTLSGREYWTKEGSFTSSGQDMDLQLNGFTNPSSAVIRASDELTLTTRVGKFVNERGGLMGSENGRMIINSNNSVENKGVLSGNASEITANFSVENDGILSSRQSIIVQAQTIDNGGGGLMVSSKLNCNSIRSFGNKGMVEGKENCSINSPSIQNKDRGLIQGEDLTISGHVVENHTGCVLGGANMTANVHTLINRQDALIYSENQMNIGGYSGSTRAHQLLNESGTIEVEGNANLKVETIQNINTGFTVRTDLISSSDVAYNEPPGAENYTMYRFRRNIHEIVVNSTKPGLIYVDGTLELECGLLKNDKSHVLSNRIVGNLNAIRNEDYHGIRTITDVGTSQYTFMAEHRGSRRYGLAGPRKKHRVRETSRRVPYNKTRTEDIDLHAFRQITDQLPPSLGSGLVKNALAQEHVSKTTAADVNLPSHLQRRIRRKIPHYTYVSNLKRLGFNSLISANEIELNVKKSLENRGLIHANKMKVDCGSVLVELGAILANESAELTTQTHFTNTGGTIAAGELGIETGSDFTSKTETRTDITANGYSTITDTSLGKIANVVGLNKLRIKAKRDVNLGASRIGSSGKGKIQAGRNINISTVEVKEDRDLRWGHDSRRRQIKTEDIGSVLKFGGQLKLKTGLDINSVGAHVQSGKGISAKANRNLNLMAGKKTLYVDEDHSSHRSYTFHDSDYRITNQLKSEVSTGTILESGEYIELEAGENLTTEGAILEAIDEVKLKTRKGLIKLDTGKSHGYQNISIEQSLDSLLSSSESKSTVQREGVQNNPTIIKSHTKSVVLEGGRKITQKGSVVVGATTVKAEAPSVDIIAAKNTSHITQTMTSEESGFKFGVSNPALDAFRTVEHLYNLQSSLEGEGTEFVQAMSLATGGLAAYNAWTSIAKQPKSLGGLGISVSFGTSSFQASQSMTQEECVPSVFMGGEQAIITATESDINVVGSQVLAEKGDVVLNAKKAINLIAQENITTGRSSSSSSSMSIGVGIQVGEGKSGLSLQASMSGNEGQGVNDAKTHTNTLVSALNGNLSCKSGGETNIRGAALRGKKVSLSVGTDLEIKSLQDTEASREKESGFGASLSISPWQGTGSVQFHGSMHRADYIYKSVVEQTGIEAGTGGYDIEVGGNTHLEGGAIRSALAESNSLVTGSLTCCDLQNESKFTTDDVSVGIGFNLSTNSSRNKCAPVGILPIAMRRDGSSENTTSSSICDAQSAVKVRNSAGRPDLMLKRLEENSKEVGSGPLAKEYDREKIRASIAVAKTFIQEIGKFASNKYLEGVAKSELADTLEAILVNTEIDSEKRVELNEQTSALRAQSVKIKQDWGPGGTYRQIVNAISIAATGSANAQQFALNSAIGFTSQKLAQNVGQLVSSGDLKEGSPGHVAIHALIGLAAGSMQADAVSGGIGAGLGALLPALLVSDDSNDNQVLESNRNIIASIISVLTFNSGGNASTATGSALFCMDNNFLTSKHQAYLLEQYKKAKSGLEKCTILGRRLLLSGDIYTGLVQGLKEGGIRDVRAIAQFLMNIPGALANIRKIVSDPDVISKVADATIGYLKNKLERIEYLLHKEGEEYELGRELGELIWTVGLTLYSTASLAKGVTQFTKFGIRGGIRLAQKAPTITMQGMGNLVKNHVMMAAMPSMAEFSFQMKMLERFRKMSIPQKCTMGEVLGSQKLMSMVGYNMRMELISVAQSFGHTGIDAIYKVTKGRQVGYIVAEFKAGSGTLGMTKKFGKQMSNPWVVGNLSKALAGNTAEFMMAWNTGRVAKVLVTTNSAGETAMSLLGPSGQILKPAIHDASRAVKMLLP